VAPAIVVTAAVIEQDGRFLLTRRQAGVHLEGVWEFPGGKCHRNEALAACLSRELHEELDVDVRIREEIFTVTHAYPEKTVELHFFRCIALGEPRPVLGQEMRWVPRAELVLLEFPAADAKLIAMLTRRV
jgi:mutator protein MutT